MTHLVECMEVSLTLLLLDNSRLFKKIIVDVTSNGVTFKVKVDVHVFSESGGVVVAIGLGVSKSLQDIVRLKENIFDSFNFILLSNVCNLSNSSF